MKPTKKLPAGKDIQSVRVDLLVDRAVEIDGQTLRPDDWTAFMEFYLGFAFPSVTLNGTAMHPQVLANSFASLKWKVFNIAHKMRAYDPEANPQDHIVGTIVAVEFPPEPKGGWTVQADPTSAPSIRAAAAVHKRAQGVDRILGEHLSGRITWTVSMENDFMMEDCGFAIRTGGARLDLKGLKTPDDMRAIGWEYIPLVDAPDDLLLLLGDSERWITGAWNGMEVVLMKGGLDGVTKFFGTGLTPAGKERQARMGQVLASEDLFKPLKKSVQVLSNVGHHYRQ